MDGLNKLKSKFMRIVQNKPKGSNARQVRVNLPASLGGGFTVLMCFMDGGQSVAGFLRALIAMLQSSSGNAETRLQVKEYGLTPSRRRRVGEEGEEEEDEEQGPPVFLHPDSLIADAFGDEPELHVDLRLLRPARKGSAPVLTRADQGAPRWQAEDSDGETTPTRAQAASSGSYGLNGAAAAAAARTSRPQRHLAAPMPPAQRVLHYTCLSKLKRLRPPADAPAEVIVVSTLEVPCSLPHRLARSLPPSLQTAALTSSLSARQASCAARDAAAASAAANVAAGFSSAAAAATPSATPVSHRDSPASSSIPELSRKDRREQARIAKALGEYAAHLYDLLLARGIGEDPHLKLQLAAQLMAASRSKGSSAEGERIGTSAAASGAGGGDMWSGWENETRMRASQDADMLEVPLLFVRTADVPVPAPKHFNPTDDCFVVTNRRALQIERGAVTTELALGSESGNVIRLPRDTEDGEPGRCPLRLLVKNVVQMEREEREAGEGRSNGHGGGGGGPPDDEDEDGDPPSAPYRRRRPSSASSSSRAVTFFVPNPDIAGFLEEYLMYLQEKSSLEAQLGLVEQARLDRIAHERVERCLRGWTLLLKSLVGPLLFGPLRKPTYEQAIKGVLARVQQMDLKGLVKITSLKLLSLHIPQLDSLGAAASGGRDGGAAAAGEGDDQIPSLRLASYSTEGFSDGGGGEFIFDIYWSAPSFAIKIEISGRKIVSFTLQLEMRGIEVRGSIRLRSSPSEPEKSAVSFVSLPQLSFGVSSHVIVGSVKLPFQRAIEKIIYAQIQAAIEAGLRENVVGDKWQSIHYEKSGLGLELDRWSNIASYPFKYDGTDDEDMLAVALVVTSQAEGAVRDTLGEMSRNREKMEACLGRSGSGARKIARAQAQLAQADAAAAAASSAAAATASSSAPPTPSHKASSSGASISNSRRGSDKERERDKERDKSRVRSGGERVRDSQNNSPVRPRRKNTAPPSSDDDEPAAAAAEGGHPSSSSHRSTPSKTHPSAHVQTTPAGLGSDRKPTRRWRDGDDEG